MDNISHVHFIGIGGIGMSGLARLVKHEGKEVSGSDTTQTENTKKLEAEGVVVAYEQTAENIRSRSNLELVVYTEAVHEDNPELVAARQAGIRTVSYFEALGEIANEYYLIAVAGTHGKTTTTAMLIDILEEASYDPTAIVGSLRTKTGSNFRAGKSKYFIVEACEYKRDFLTLEPDVLVITNIEHEHVDYYKDLADVQDAFRELALKVPEGGTIIYDSGNSNVAPVVTNVSCNVIDYGSFFEPLLCLPQPGLYNQLNAAAAIATAATLGIEVAQSKHVLENFVGTHRRFEYKGEVNGAKVYDDYAHHPTEIEATISGVRDLYPDKKLTVVFQSHTYSRTHELFDAFAESLSEVDRVLILPIYAAREENKSGVSAEKLVEAIQEKGTDAEYFYTFEGVVAEIKESVSTDDVVFVMGAGDVVKVTEMLTK